MQEKGQIGKFVKILCCFRNCFTTDIFLKFNSKIETFKEYDLLLLNIDRLERIYIDKLLF